MDPSELPVSSVFLGAPRTRQELAGTWLRSPLLSHGISSLLLSPTAPDCACPHVCLRACVCTWLRPMCVLCMLPLSYMAAAALSPGAILPPCGMHPGVDGLQSCSHPRPCTPTDSGCVDAPVEGKYIFYMHRDALRILVVNKTHSTIHKNQFSATVTERFWYF